MNNAVSAAVERYSAEISSFRVAAKIVEDRVRKTADGGKISCTVSGREKDVRSFHKKIFAKNYADPWRDVTDKAGVRAVVQSARDVDRLVDLLKAEFGEDVLSVEDKRQVSNPAMLAYSGVHVQVLAVPESTDYEPIECEIQLRTAAQDAWSIVSHQVLYKPILSLPPKLQHAMYRLVALVEMFDEEVQRVMDAMQELPGTEVLDLLEAAEKQFLPLAHSPSNREVSVIILQGIAGSIEELEREHYGELLSAFVDSEREKLIGLYEEYGAHSAVSYVPSYMLFGQAESLILFERLNSRPHSLVAHWRASALPYDYLEALAGAASIALPEDS